MTNFTAKAPDRSDPSYTPVIHPQDGPQSDRRPVHIPAEDVQLSSVDVCRLARITYRQLDHWLRVGLVTCNGDRRGSGAFRAFDLEQTRRVLLLAWLTAHGLDPRRAAQLLDLLPQPQLLAILPPADVERSVDAP